MLKLLMWLMILVWGGQSILLLLLFAYQLLKQNLDRINPAEPSSDENAGTTAKVTTIVHGNTIQIEIDGEQQTISLADVECPDSDEDDGPFGDEAKQFTSVHCLDQSVQIVRTGRQGERWTAYVLLPNGQYLQHELIRHGLAWHVQKDSESAEELKALEDEAKEKRVGIWSRQDKSGPANDNFAAWNRLDHVTFRSH